MTVRKSQPSCTLSNDEIKLIEAIFGSTGFIWSENFYRNESFLDLFNRHKENIENKLFEKQFISNRGMTTPECFYQVMHTMISELEQTLPIEVTHAPLTVAEILTRTNPLEHDANDVAPTSIPIISNATVYPKNDLLYFFDKTELELNPKDLKIFRSIKYKLLLLLSNNETGDHLLLNCPNNVVRSASVYSMKADEIPEYFNFYKMYLGYLSQRTRLFDLLSRPFTTADLHAFRDNLTLNEWQSVRDNKIINPNVETPVNKALTYLEKNKSHYVRAPRALNKWLYHALPFVSSFIGCAILLSKLTINYPGIFSHILGGMFLPCVYVSFFIGLFLLLKIMPHLFSAKERSINSVSPFPEAAVPAEVPAPSSMTTASVATITHSFSQRNDVQSSASLAETNDSTIFPRLL